MGMPYPDHVDMMERLKSLEEETKIFKLIEPTTDNYVLPYCFEVAYNDWLDRMTEGKGCWGD